MHIAALCNNANRSATYDQMYRLENLYIQSLRSITTYYSSLEELYDAELFDMWLAEETIGSTTAEFDTQRLAAATSARTTKSFGEKDRRSSAEYCSTGWSSFATGSTISGNVLRSAN